MFNVVDIDKLDLTKINIKKPYTLKKNNDYEFVSFDLYNSNKPILLMTKTLQIYSKTNFSLQMIQNTKKGCLNILSKIHNSILERIKSIEEYKKYIINKKIFKIISKHNESRILSIKNICNIDTVIFNSNNDIININNIKFQDNVRLILYLKNIWIGQNNIGISIKISQIQRLEPLLLYKSLFSKEYSQQIHEESLLPQQLLPPPPPPPPSPSLLQKPKQNNLQLQLHNERMRNSLLQIEEKDKKNQKNEQRAINTRPSLCDIIASKNKLRKTNILC